MTLGDIKKRVFALIEELSTNSDYYTDDNDYQKKINYIIDTYQNELSRLKPIAAYDTIKVKKGDIIELPKEIERFYRLDAIKGVSYENFNNIVTFTSSGTATINYYKYPKVINEDTPNDYKMEITQDVCEILIYGVAADILKEDVSANRGQIYANAYNEALQKLNFSSGTTTFQIVGGIDV